MDGRGKMCFLIKNVRPASAEKFSKNGPGPARNPAPYVYDPTGATSLKTRYAPRFHRPPPCFHCTLLASGPPNIHSAGISSRGSFTRSRMTRATFLSVTNDTSRIDRLIFEKS